MRRIRFYNLAYQRNAGKQKPSISRIVFITFTIFGRSTFQKYECGFLLINLRNLELLFDIKVSEDWGVKDFQF